jgi:hypothetical protein
MSQTLVYLIFTDFPPFILCSKSAGNTNLKKNITKKFLPANRRRTKFPKMSTQNTCVKLLESLQKRLNELEQTASIHESENSENGTNQIIYDGLSCCLSRALGYFFVFQSKPN